MLQIDEGHSGLACMDKALRQTGGRQVHSLPAAELASLTTSVTALLEDREGKHLDRNSSVRVSPNLLESGLSITPQAQGLARGLDPRDSSGFERESLVRQPQRRSLQSSMESASHAADEPNKGPSGRFRWKTFSSIHKTRVYVATDGGLSILEGGRFRNYTTKEGLPSNILKALGMDHQGNCGSAPLERRRFAFRRQTLHALIFRRWTPLNDRISSLCGRICSRRIWFGDVTRSHRPRGACLRRSYSSKDGLGARQGWERSRKIRTAQMWFGTDSGCHFDGRNFKTYSTADGLPDQFISFLAVRPGWPALDRHAQRYFPQFDPSRGRFRNFSTRDGLLSNVMVDGVLPLDRDGQLWFEAALESPAVTLTIRMARPVAPLVHLEDIRVFDQTVPAHGSTNCALKRTQLSFIFVGLSFRDESRVRYRYFLDELRLRLAASPPVFTLPSTRMSRRAVTVSTSNPPAMKKTGAMLRGHDLRILPFFYQTPLFLSLVLVGGAGLISGIFKWRGSAYPPSEPGARKPTCAFARAK